MTKLEIGLDKDREDVTAIHIEMLELKYLDPKKMRQKAVYRRLTDSIIVFWGDNQPGLTNAKQTEDWRLRFRVRIWPKCYPGSKIIFFMVAEEFRREGMMDSWSWKRISRQYVSQH